MPGRCQIPTLGVAGVSHVSRSMFSGVADRQTATEIAAWLARAVYVRIVDVSGGEQAHQISTAEQQQFLRGK
jgi:hypothetical protein